MKTPFYLMENEQEALRLEMKTDPQIVEKQARWAGIKSGMKVLDVGCGPGLTTSRLNDLVQPGGMTVGIDFSDQRLEYAKKQYTQNSMDFVYADIREPLIHMGKFDFIWVRFVLEYFRSSSFEIVQNLTSLLNPNGILCLIDLDHNCLTHFGFPQRVENTIHNIIRSLEDNADFDPYVGRKLYSFLYDLGYQEIDVELAAHHLIFGDANEIDLFNWAKKAEIVSRMSIGSFDDYDGDHKIFCQEFTKCFSDQRRFIYTPVISCRGTKPTSSN